MGAAAGQALESFGGSKVAFFRDEVAGVFGVRDACGTTSRVVEGPLPWTDPVSGAERGCATPAAPPAGWSRTPSRGRTRSRATNGGARRLRHHQPGGRGPPPVDGPGLGRRTGVRDACGTTSRVVEDPLPWTDPVSGDER